VSAPPPTPVVTATPPLTACQRKFQAWYATPAHTAVDRLTPALRRGSADAYAGDLTAAGSELVRIGRLALKMARHPLPRCADPHHYWARAIAAMLLASAEAPGVTLDEQAAISAATVQVKRIGAAMVKLTAAIQALAP
jgi:hypothetical protein